MAISDYLKSIRDRIGNDLLLVPSAAAVVRDAEGRILLARRCGQDMWVIPGGGIDPEESPADAAVRETWEETGVVAEPFRVLGVYGGQGYSVTYANGDQVSYTMTVFECRYVSGEPRPDGTEMAEAAFFPLEALGGLALPDWMQTVMPVVLNRTAEVYFQPAGWRPPSTD